MMTNRRDFLKQSFILAAGGVVGSSILPGCGGSSSKGSASLTPQRVNDGIYDIHVHASGGAGLQAFLDAGKKFIDETVQVDAVNLLVYNGNTPRSVSAHLMSLALKTVDPRYTAYGGFAYWLPCDEQGLRTQLEDMMDAGFDGLKMIEGKPTNRRTDPALALDHPRYNSVGELLQSTGYHILNHVNDPEEFWFPDQVPSWSSSASSGGYWETDRFLPKEQHYEEAERWFARYPRMNITFAHAYFLSNFPDRMEALFEKFPKVSIDLTPGVEMFDGFTKQRDRWIPFFIKYQDRILFGTDNRVSHLEQKVGHDGSYFDRIAYMRRFLETDDKFEAWGYNLHGFALPENVIKKIYRENALRLRGAVKPVVPAKALKYANKLFAGVKDRTDLEDITRQECREVVEFFEKRV
jgi:predicted TIM-barrel fold metal-dependent hydrolase